MKNLIRIGNRIINTDKIISAVFTPKDENSFGDDDVLLLNLSEYHNIDLVSEEAERVWQALSEGAYTA